MAKAPLPNLPKAEDFFKLPDFHIPELPHSLREYGKLAEVLWTSAPAYIERYAQSIKEAWTAYADTYIKRFEALPAPDKAKFLNSGLDGAVVFLILTIIARRVLNRHFDPYLMSAYLWPKHHNTRRRHYDNPTAGQSMSYDKMKWLFATSVLLATWHMNTHQFFNYGKKVDLGIFGGVVTGLSILNYRRTRSISATLTFFIIPLLVLLPVAGTVLTMQQGPLIKNAKQFPAFVAGVTVITAIYFMIQAPSTPVVMSSKGGYQREVPFRSALREEFRQLWRGDWSGTLMSVPRSVAKRASSSHRKSANSPGRSRNRSYYDRPRDAPHHAVGAVSALLTGALGSGYKFGENVVHFFITIVYRMVKFVQHMVDLTLHSALGGVTSIPGLSQYLKNYGHGGTRRTRSSKSRQGGGRGKAPRLSRRVSQTKD